MGIPKEQFKNRDIFISYDYEDVMFRYDHISKRFYRKFYDESDECEVSYDNRLLNDAILGGDEIDISTYFFDKTIS